MTDALGILVVHGPNLNLLGTREPEVYGSVSLEEIDTQLEAVGKENGCQIECCQSNHEGVLIDRIQEARSWASGILINPAGLTHSSVSLRDALVAVEMPVVEVHLSNIFAREDFRHHSFVSGIAVGIVSGFGADSYRMGLEALLRHIEQS